MPDNSEVENDGISEEEAKRIPELNELLEAADELPEEKRESYQRAVYSMFAKITHASFQSPIPPPEYIEAYEKMQPGGLDRILKMAEKQQEHRHKLESVVVIGNGLRESRGQWIAAFLATLALVFGFHLINTDKDAEGFLILIGATATLVSVFFYAKNRQTAELRERMKRLREKPDNTDLLPQTTIVGNKK